MNSLLLLAIAAALFLIAYVTYGKWLSTKWGIDISREVPAKKLQDGIDYVPTDAKVVLGHHFSSIAGAGPITGPILASVFGWLPVYLWIILGSIFIGGVHDFGALFASLRHDGKSIGEIMKINIGQKGKMLFNIFAYAAIILVVAAFTDICASTFQYLSDTPDNITGARAGTSSLLFIVLAIIFGYFVYRKSAKLSVATILGVACLFFCIFIGYVFPVVKLSKTIWDVILIIYIALASILPVWILLQPRDYLCSFLLYTMVIGGFLGVIFASPTMELSAFKGFTVNSQTLFPFLFVTVACGAVSGFHSLVASGTTAKQVRSEKDARLIGYGAMLIEGVIAVLALIAVSYTATSEGTPAAIFANGIATFMNKFGLPLDIGKVFITLTFSAFALTSLDTATRIARYLFQEMFDDAPAKIKNIFGNMYVATGVTIALSAALLGYGYDKIWPMFGASNQLLAALALLAISAWLAKSKKKTAMTVIPMIFMFIVSLTALGKLIMTNLFGETTNILLGVISIILFVLAIILVINSIVSLSKAKKQETHSA